MKLKYVIENEPELAYWLARELAHNALNLISIREWIKGTTDVRELTIH